MLHYSSWAVHDYYRYKSPVRHDDAQILVPAHADDLSNDPDVYHH